MDIKELICGSNSGGKWRSDALQSVKLDPAVLEAQITIDTNSKTPTPEPVLDISKNTDACQGATNFEEMMKMQKAALLSLDPLQLELLLKYAGTLRKQRLSNIKQLECAFCKNNGEPASWYTRHMLRDRSGRLRCPVLRCYRCHLCGATGDRAHTIKYCPENQHSEFGRLWSR